MLWYVHNIYVYNAKASIPIKEQLLYEVGNIKGLSQNASIPIKEQLLWHYDIKRF